MAIGASIKQLLGRDLQDFKIVEMTEVYRLDEDGLKCRSIGFFRDATIAAGFAGAQTDASWHRTAQALVLTDGTIGYVIEDQNLVKLLDDEAEALEIKKQAVAKLSPAERKLLGFE